MSYKEKYDYQLKRHGIPYSATANGLLVEADKELEAKDKLIAELKKKYSELSEFNLQIRIDALNDLKKAFTFKGHSENSIQPEELNYYIEKLTNKE